jgi:hypothetical protein
MSKDLMLAEFKGTYRIPHPDGIKGESVLRPFHVIVKMKKQFLEAPGLHGFFLSYYANQVKKCYPDMISIYHVEFQEAKELDGKVINNPKALSFKNLRAYIHEKNYPINTALYSDVELRNEVVLYESDPKGQQHLQKRREDARGGEMEVARELSEIEDLVVRLDAANPGGKANKRFAEALIS